MIKNKQIKQRNKLNSLILLVFSFILVFTLSCEEEEKELLRIEIGNYEDIKEVTLGKYEVEDIKVRLVYIDATMKLIPLERKMISKEDLPKLTSIGTHSIKVTYNEKYVVFDLTILENIDSLKKANIVLDKSEFTYTGFNIEPKVKIIYNEKELINTIDYTLEYFNNRNAGTGVVKATGIGKYCDEIIAIYTINKAKLVVKANDLEIMTSENPNFSVSYQGFLGLDTENSLSGKLNFECQYKDDEAGRYEIIPSGLNSLNYDITYEKGILKTNIITLTDDNVLVEQGPFTYTGKEIKPNITVIEDGIILDSNDYNLEYTNNINSGIGRIKVTCKNHYIGIIEKTFTIVKKNLTVQAESYEINYLDKLPSFEVIYDGFVTGENEEKLTGELSFNCEQNGNVGSYEITPIGLESNNYIIDYISGKLIIKPLKITDITIAESYFIYSGEEITPKVDTYVTIDGENKYLTLDEFILSYKNNINAGLASVTCQGVNNYEGSITKYYQINQKELTIKVDDQKVIYNSKPNKYTSSITGFVPGDDETKLNGDFVYMTNYSNKVGIYDIVVSGMNSNNYLIKYEKGTIEVKPYQISDNEFTLLNTNYEYKNEAIMPTIIPNVLNEKVILGYDYNVEYLNNINVGEAKIIIKGIGNYSGELTKKFNINKKNVTISSNNYYIIYGDVFPNVEYSISGLYSNDSSVTGEINIDCEYINNPSSKTYDIILSGLTSNNYIFTYKKGSLIVSSKTLDQNNCLITPLNNYYNGEEILCDITCNDGSKLLQNNQDYLVTYTNNINAGLAFVRIDFINNYKGYYSCSYEIKPCDITLALNEINIEYLDDEPNLEYVLTGIEESRFKENIIINSTYKKGYLPGEYKLTFDKLSSNNYNVTYIENKIMVNGDKEFEGDGTYSNPYVISNISELTGLSQRVENGENFKDKYFVLNSDLDYQGYNLLMIGKEGYPFEGDFDFKYHKISNYTISNKLTSTGIFGLVIGSSISNLTINNFISELSGSCIDCGGLVGKGTNVSISNIIINNALINQKASYGVNIGLLSGKLEDSEVTNVICNGSINAQRINNFNGIINIGGVIGEANNTNLTNGYTNIDLLSNCGNIGGLVGDGQYLIIKNMFSLGKISSNGDAKMDELVCKKLYCHLDNSYIDSNFIIEKTGYINQGISLENICEKMRLVYDQTWIFDYQSSSLIKLPMRDYDVLLINKPNSLNYVYSEEFNYNESYFIIDSKGIDIRNCGEYTVDLILKDGYLWSDGTNSPLENVTLIINKKQVYVDINSLVISQSSPYKLSCSVNGLLEEDKDFFSKIILKTDYNGDVGDYIIDIEDITFDNYEINVNKGILHVNNITNSNSWSIWDGTYQDGEFEGTGAINDPYLIDSAKALATLAYKVNNNMSSNYYYKLTKNIDLNMLEWPIIGDTYGFSSFQGKLDGNGYVISNLLVTGNKRYAGLFGHMKNAEVFNLDIINCLIDVSNIESCYVGSLSGMIENSNISSVSVEGNINSKVYFGILACGGIGGYVYKNSTINDSFTNVNINILDLSNNTDEVNSYAGGIVGYGNDLTISHVYTKGNVNSSTFVNNTYVAGIIAYANNTNLDYVISYVNCESNGLPCTIYCYTNGSSDTCYYHEDVLLTKGESPAFPSSFNGNIKSEEELEEIFNNYFDQRIWYIGLDYPPVLIY